MKKIPTIFERDWNGDRSRVIDKLVVDEGWLIGAMPMRKYDGTSCLILSGSLWKRRELKKGQVIPADFDIADIDDETGKVVGWVPVGDGPEDTWHRMAFSAAPRDDWRDGTYELCGPKVQGNPERLSSHELIRHAAAQSFGDVPIDFDGLNAWLAERDIEGLVFHHPDGRMAKIKKRDFGLKRRA
jgi:hypothetical protein